VILRAACDGIDINGNNMLFENNVLGDSYATNCHQDGFEVYGPNDGLIIRNNLVFDWTQNIYLTDFDGGIRNVEITGNVVWCDSYCDAGNDAPGLALFADNNRGGIQGLRIEGNTFYRVWNLIYGSTSGVVIGGNIFYGAGEGVVFPGNATTLRNLYYQVIDDRSHEPGVLWNVDPRFRDISGSDFRLRPDSPAIDAGVVIHGLHADPHGVERPQGNGYDIGACEFNLTYPHQ
jgi:hypothetical protein